MNFILTSLDAWIIIVSFPLCLLFGNFCNFVYFFIGQPPTLDEDWFRIHFVWQQPKLDEHWLTIIHTELSVGPIPTYTVGTTHVEMKFDISGTVSCRTIKRSGTKREASNKLCRFSLRAGGLPFYNVQLQAAHLMGFYIPGTIRVQNEIENRGGTKPVQNDEPVLGKSRHRGKNYQFTINSCETTCIGMYIALRLRWAKSWCNTFQHSDLWGTLMVQRHCTSILWMKNDFNPWL